MRARAVVLNAALSVATATWAPAVFAQGDAPTTEDRNAAAKDFADGDHAFKNGDYRAAAESYEAAYKILPHHAALWNAARSWHRAGDLPRAANLYAKYLQEAPPSARDRNSAIKALNELSPKVAHLQIHATDVQGVKVDGVPVQASDVYVTPGAHVVEGQTRDGRNVRQSQNVEAGDTVSVALLAPASAASALVAPLSTPAESQQTGPSHGWSPIIVYFGGAVTAVLAGITVWSGIDTLQRKDAFDQTPTQSGLDVGRQAQTRTNVLIVATAGVGVATGLAAIFLVDWHARSDGKTDSSPPPPASAGLRDVRLGVGPGALLLQGAF